MFVTREIRDRLEGDTSDDIEEDRYGRLRADLEAFVTEPDLFPKYIFWLTPRPSAVWEIRSVEDQPSLRVLGRFAQADVFIALTIEERAELGGWNTPQWRRAIRTCIQRWNTIFTPYPPLLGVQASDFFSGAVPARYFKK